MYSSHNHFFPIIIFPFNNERNTPVSGHIKFWPMNLPDKTADA